MAGLPRWTGLSAGAPDAAARLWLCLFVAISGLALLFLMAFDLKAEDPSHIDVFYFSACAARGLDMGAIPVPGCHDNKAPLIFLLYQAIFKLAGLYNFAAVKLAADLLILLDVALLAATAWRLAGFAAACVTAALVMSALAVDISAIVLRTDLVGGVLLAAALFILSRPGAIASYRALALAGLAIGAAVTAKQNFAFPAVAVCAWIALEALPLSQPRFIDALKRCALFGVCVLVPFALFWLAFAAQGRTEEFLLSMFLYPAIYGAGKGASAAAVIRHAASLLAGFKDQVLLAALFAGAVAALLRSGLGKAVRFADPRWLLLLVSILLILPLVNLPSWFPYYIVSVCGPMAVLAGAMLAQHWRAAPTLARPALAALCVGALVYAAQTWRTNGNAIPNAVTGLGFLNIRADAATPYAYQLGTESDFYGRGHFIPASSVQFAWALPGTPDIWAYEKPSTATWTGRALARQQARNLEQLYSDFRRTPPGYIVLDSDFVRAAQSRAAADIPGFQNYLNRNCRLMGEYGPRQPVVTMLYRCNAPTR